MKRNQNIDVSSVDESSIDTLRRKLTIAAVWTTPMVIAVSLPAHAQTSPSVQPEPIVPEPEPVVINIEIISSSAEFNGKAGRATVTVSGSLVASDPSYDLSGISVEVTGTPALLGDADLDDVYLQYLGSPYQTDASGNFTIRFWVSPDGNSGLLEPYISAVASNFNVPELGISHDYTADNFDLCSDKC